MTTQELFVSYKRDPTQGGLVRLLEALATPVYSMCYNVLRNHHDAQDAAQMVLLKVVGSVNRLPEDVYLQGWVYRTSVNAAIDSRRGGLRRRKREEEAANMQNMNRVRGSNDAWGALHDALGQLRADMRELLVKYHYEGRTLQELAAEQGCSTNAVWKKLGKGRARLEEALAGSGCAAMLPGLDGLLAAPASVAPPTALVSGLLVAKAGSEARAASLALPARLVARLGWKPFVVGSGGIAILVAAVLTAVPRRPDPAPGPSLSESARPPAARTAPSVSASTGPVSAAPVAASVRLESPTPAQPQAVRKRPKKAGIRPSTQSSDEGVLVALGLRSSSIGFLCHLRAKLVGENARIANMDAIEDVVLSVTMPLDSVRLTRVEAKEVIDLCLEMAGFVVVETEDEDRLALMTLAEFAGATGEPVKQDLAAVVTGKSVHDGSGSAGKPDLRLLAFVFYPDGVWVCLSDRKAHSIHYLQEGGSLGHWQVTDLAPEAGSVSLRSSVGSALLRFESPCMVTVAR
ncbi:MAG: sigma-70 family RNA polymerase sigma factor [Kiritimatiellae bacterium]|nr:sigma-70 family RNA polymerase sigma factor [Kiritimatiellia bacterium]